MTSPTIGTTAEPSLRDEALIIGLVSVAHGLSHFFQLVVPPLFLLMKDEFALSYAALGGLTSIVYLVSGLSQTPAGFAVDRFGARNAIVIGLVLMSVATLVVASATSYWMLAAAAVIAGFGNCVFHPADLALLNQRITPRRLGYAFSVHNVSGNLGWTLAPLFSAGLATIYGWRVALIVAGAIGLAYTAVFASQSLLAMKVTRGIRADAANAGVGLLFSAPVLMSFGFFLLLSMSVIGYVTFAPTALNQLYGLPVIQATGMLTSFLVGSVIGTFAGGAMIGWTDRHDRIAMLGMLSGAAGTLLVATGMLPIALLTVVVGIVGFAIGSVSPARDILVRSIAPEHVRGRVYGFVYSGLDSGAAVAPLAFGWLLDHGLAGWMFGAAALMMVASLPTIMKMKRQDHS